MIDPPITRINRILQNVDRTVLHFSLARVPDAMAQSAVIIAIPVHAAQFDTATASLSTTAFAGILISTFAIANTATQPLGGALVDRTGRRKPWVLLGILLISIGTLALVFAQSPAQLIVLQIFRGVGFGLTNAPSLMIVSGADAKSGRGGSIGLFFTIRSLGFGLGPILGGFLLGVVDLRTTYLVSAILSASSLGLLQLIHKEIRASGTRANSPKFRMLDRSMFEGRIVAVSLTLAIAIFGMGFLLPLMNEFTALLRQSALGIGSAFSATLFASLVMQTPAGRLSDRVGRVPPIVTGLLLMAPVIALQGFVETYVQLVVLRTIQGVAMALVMAPAFALVADWSTAGVRGRQLSVPTMGVDLGASAAPIAAGFLVVYGLELPFVIGGILSLLGIGVILIAARPREKVMDSTLA